MALIGLSHVIYLCLTLLLRKVKVDLLLPSSVLVGLFLCFVGPNGLGQRIGDWVPFYQNLMDEFKVFSKLPGELINFVFAGIFLGQTVPSAGVVLKTSRSHLLGGYWLGLGQHFIGVLTCGLVLSKFFDVSASMGTLLPISFQGGHGTVAGLETIFQKLEMTHATQMGYAIATIGVLLAVVAGAIVIRGSERKEDAATTPSDSEDSCTNIERPPHTDIMMAMGLLWLIIFIAKILRQSGMSLVDRPLGVDAFRYLPIFPIAMVLGFVWQKAIGVDFLGENARYIVKQIQNTALFILLLSASASLDFNLIHANWQLVLTLSVAGAAWNLASLWLIFPRFFSGNPRDGIGEFCQCAGTSAIGLRYVKHVSAKAERGFNYKQILYEPFLGGGLFTAFAIPLVNSLGWAIYCLLIGLLLISIFVIHLLTAEQRTTA